jgi:tRNA pseudouridine38-40 synthase
MPADPADPLRTIKLLIEFEGTNYVGWQYQDNGPSVQAEIEKAMASVTGEQLRVTGAGRTDAGVHALAMAAHLRTHTRLPAAKIALALSAYLPKDIAVWQAEDMPDNWHSRRDAKGKIYRYSMHTGRGRPVLDRHRVAHVIQELDVDAMRAAAPHIVGEQDFSAFVTELKAREHHCVRTVYRCDVWREGPRVHVEVEGNGFLYNMVRTIAGTLTAVGKGKEDPEWVRRVIDSRDRTQAGEVMPAKGLCLMRVLY